MMSIKDNSKYRMPGEFEPHQGCIMAWPSEAIAWGDENLEAVQNDYVRVAHAISQFESVTMVVSPEYVERARAKLGGEIALLTLPLSEAWFRDTGPSMVKKSDGQLAGVSWRFNGWGNTSPQYERDIPLAKNVLHHFGFEVVCSNLATEGGALCVDGDGTLLTTETSVLNKNRNPDWSREEVELEFQRTLGIEKVIWLPGDPYEVGTNGHIDGIACFVRPGVVLFETTASIHESSRQVIERNFNALLNQTDAKGRKLELLFVQEASDRMHQDHTEEWGMSTSYINFYIANGGIIMPKFNEGSDEAAVDAIKKAFPERRVVQVDISNLRQGGGGIHCITQQIPKV